MAEPTNQHFIPQSYLRNFAQSQKKEKYIESYNLIDNKFVKPNIRNICSKRNLYTLPATAKEGRYYLEKYYAENVDSVYAEVYSLLVDKNVSLISKNKKYQIISTILNFYFRTPKFLNRRNKLISDFIDSEALKSIHDDFEITFDNVKYSIHKNKLEEEKQEIFESNRQMFLVNHIKEWRQFVDYKLKCPFWVYELKDDVELITSDNPVIVDNALEKPFSLFDPTNIIQVPLDRKHFLFILPNTEHEKYNIIKRSYRDKTFALVSNSLIEKNAEQWIMGYPGSVYKHFKDQEKYNKPSPENFKMVTTARQKFELMQDLLGVMKTNGTFSSQVAKMVGEYRNLDCFKDDADIERIVNVLEGKA